MSWLILKSVRFRKLLCGKPVILIDNGKILYENLKATRVTMDELTGHLRQKDVLDVQSVQYAILETDGSLSVFPYSQDQPQYLPITIVEDGFLSRENLGKAGKDRAWLHRVCGSDLKSILLLTVDARNQVVLLRKEQP